VRATGGRRGDPRPGPAVRRIRGPGWPVTLVAQRVTEVTDAAGTRRHPGRVRARACRWST